MSCVEGKPPQHARHATSQARASLPTSLDRTRTVIAPHNTWLGWPPGDHGGCWGGRRAHTCTGPSDATLEV
eukprot:scaffold398_cov356-Pavlova_lutheri.AAC.2